METVLAHAMGLEASHLAAEEKRDLLSRLLARLAHEIRNPLSSLNIHVQLLEEDLGQLAPGTREPLLDRLEIIHGELHRLENIVKHFLRLAKPSELEMEPVDAAKLVRHVCELLRPEAAERGIEVAAEVQADLSLVMADSVQLTQALLNLVINAVQAVGKGGRVLVRANRDPSPKVLRIEVEDTGPGIPPDKHAAIFEPYFTTKPEGSGLGLWIAQQIVSAHHGKLAVANAPERGALFTLTLPVPQESPRG